ncbi:MauE/DoxX family redox-associated membrane protein [Salinactinospora qingdaonensis]
MSTETQEPPPTGATGQRSWLRWAVIQPWLTLAARLGLVGVLGYAGYTKIIVPALSVASVDAYQLFSEEINRIVGFGLPLLELALAALLLVGLATRYVGAASGLLMLVFIAGIISAWARGLAIDCGCFGTGGAVAPEETEYGVDILRDLGFALMAGFIMIWPRSPLALDGLLGLFPQRDKDA